MKITVAICTWNRATLLDKTLDEMRKLEIAPGVEWELLIVNNRCTDQTDQVIARHSAHLPIRRLFEPKQGHSNARNCALAAAQGDLIVWTDDDVLVAPEWLNEYVAAAERWPDAAFFGGTIEPWFEVEPPRWFRRHFEAIKSNYALCSYGPEHFPFPPDLVPYGANMAFRAEILKQFVFDVRLGRSGDSLVGWDESTMFAQLQAAGYHGVWIGTARVNHYIPKERLTLRYFRRWNQGAGETTVRMQGPPAGRCWWGAPRWVWKDYWREWSKAKLLSPWKNLAWLTSYRKAAYFEGLIKESQAESRKARRSRRGAPVGITAT